jgi:hypothetical protein
MDSTTMQVNDLALNPEQTLTRSGARVVATFTVTTDEIIVRDLMYVKLPSGATTIWSPKSRRDHSPTVSLRPELRARVMATVEGHLADIRRLAA